MRKIILSFLILTILLFYPSTLNNVEAKKKIIRSKASATLSTGTRLIIKPKLRNDRRALIVNFSNLEAVSAFTYELMYTSAGISQGVSGTVTPSGESSLQRELLFATCSKNVCRYHTGIKEMKFVVTSTLKSGGKVRKTFRIKI